MTTVRALLLSLLLWTVDGEDIFEFYSTEGEIARNAVPGATLAFDAPLRISKEMTVPVSVSLPEPSVEQMFRISPGVVEPGGTFTVSLRNAIDAEIADVDFINITVRAKSLQEAANGARPLDEMQTLQVYLIGNAMLKNTTEGGKLKLNATEHTVIIPVPFRCVGGQTLHNFTVETTNSDDFTFDLSGEFSEMFHLEAAENETDDRVLQLRYSDDCNNSDRFVKELKNGLPPLVLQINGRESASQNPPAVYLIQFAPSKSQSLRASFQAKRPIEAEIAELARHFTPQFRLHVYDVDGSESNLARNFKFKFSTNNSTITDTFDVHSSTGVIFIRASEMLTIEKLGAEARFNVTLFEDDEYIDTAEVLIRLRPSDGRHNAAADASAFRFEQPVYAFAVGPGVTEVGRVRLVGDLPPMITYAISEGGASYFHIDSRSGLIIYRGGLERNAKNYTIKAIAYDTEADILETASVQVLVAGIGSLPPQLPRKFEVVEVSEDASTPLIVHTVRGVDFDQDARLQYRILNISCLSVLGQSLECDNVVYFGGNGVRNGSLMFNGIPTQATVTTDGAVSEFLHRKTNALASIFVNVSVTDTNHALEPSDYASIVIRVTRSNSKLQNNKLLCGYKFDTTQMARTIQLDDSLPPNSYVYTAAVCTPSIIDEDREENYFTVASKKHSKIIYSLRSSDEDNSARLFEIHSDTGVIRNVASLKEAPRKILLNITARDEKGDVLDAVALMIECQSFAEFPPEFPEKHYLFEVSQKSIDSKNASIGTVVANYHNTDQLQYTIVETKYPEVPSFWINSQGQIFAAATLKESPRDIATYNFFVRATCTESGKFVTVPVRVRVIPSVESRFPRFGDVSPQKATLMENAPVGTFVATISATNVQRFEIHPAGASPISARLAGALSVASTSDGAVIRTFASLRGFAGADHLLTIVAYGGARNGNETRENNAKLNLSVDIITTSNCVPAFAVDQPLVFNVTDSKPGDTIVRLRAEIEPGCELKFELTPESAQFGVLIDPSSGRITVGPTGIRNSAGENDGKGTIYMLLIAIAKSGHVTAHIGIELRVVKPFVAMTPSFYKSKLRYQVVESVAASEVIGQLSVQECFNVTYSFIDQSDGDYFSLDSNNGKISVKRSFISDDESFLRGIAVNGEPWTFHLRATATCDAQNGNTMTLRPADVFIDVVEVNNHAPEFDQAAYEFSVDKKELIGTVIGRVVAFDKDITEELYYSIDKTSYYRRGAEKRLRDVFFEVDARSGEIMLRNSLTELSGGFFELSLRVRDTLPPLIALETNQSTSGYSATISAQIWVTSLSDYVTFILEENPIHVNVSKIDSYLKTMTAAMPLSLRPARALLHDARYNFAESGYEILLNSTILRVLFVNIQQGEIIAPRKVDEFIRELALTGLKLVDKRADSTDDNIDEEDKRANARQRDGRAQIQSALISTALVFGALLTVLLTMLAVIMCYYRQRFLRERQFLRDARIANEAMAKPSTIRQFALVSGPMETAMAQRTAHLYPPNPYVTEAWDDESSEPNFYYTTQEMKISMR